MFKLTLTLRRDSQERTSDRRVAERSLGRLESAQEEWQVGYQTQSQMPTRSWGKGEGAPAALLPLHTHSRATGTQDAALEGDVL